MICPPIRKILDATVFSKDPSNYVLLKLKVKTITGGSDLLQIFRRARSQFFRFYQKKSLEFNVTLTLTFSPSTYEKARKILKS